MRLQKRHAEHDEETAGKTVEPAQVPLDVRGGELALPCRDVKVQHRARQSVLLVGARHVAGDVQRFLPRHAVAPVTFIGVGAQDDLAHRLFAHVVLQQAKRGVQARQAGKEITPPVPFVQSKQKVLVPEVGRYAKFLQHRDDRRRFTHVRGHLAAVLHGNGRADFVYHLPRIGRRLRGRGLVLRAFRRSGIAMRRSLRVLRPFRLGARHVETLHVAGERDMAPGRPLAIRLGELAPQRLREVCAMRRLHLDRQARSRTRNELGRLVAGDPLLELTDHAHAFTAPSV